MVRIFWAHFWISFTAGVVMDEAKRDVDVPW